MQRPVMDPTYLRDHDDDAADLPGGKRRKVRVFATVLRAVWRVTRAVFTLLLTELLFTRRRRGELQIQEGTAFSRFVRGLAYRAAFAPILAVLVAVALVFAGTHPQGAWGDLDPGSQAIHYDPVFFVSDDATRCEGWLVPVVDARRVLEEKEKILRKRHPAVVLVHDFGAARQQMLPLVAPLHRAGYVVLVVGLRGAGTGDVAGQTFGLNEALDVRAAVEMLRRRPFVDSNKVALLGVGTGATASLLAAKGDHNSGGVGIAALVLEQPVDHGDQVIAQRIAPQHRWLRWMQPLCEWTFELAYRVDADDLNLHRYTSLMETRPVLMLDGRCISGGQADPNKLEQIRMFLDAHLKPPAKNPQTVAATK
ncbi:MAG: alpha/beta hydrolase [Tepidisphaeraceae bacterium]